MIETILVLLYLSQNATSDSLIPPTHTLECLYVPTWFSTFWLMPSPSHYHLNGIEMFHVLDYLVRIGVIYDVRCPPT
jgi:hypothetical protein